MVSFIILNQPLSAGSFLSVGDLGNEERTRESRVKLLTTVNMDVSVQTQLFPAAASVCTYVQDTKEVYLPRGVLDKASTCGVIHLGLTSS